MNPIVRIYIEAADRICLLLTPLTDYERKTLADAIVSSDPELASELHSRPEKLIRLLPEIDQEILEFEAREIHQKVIGSLYGLSQPDISYRLSKARRRLKWLLARPTRPESFERDLWRAFNWRWRKPTTKSQARVVRASNGVALYAELTCQTKAAFLACTSQPTMQTWVRHAIAGLETPGLTDSLAYLHYTYDTRNMLSDRFGPRRALHSLVNPPTTRDGQRKS